MNRRADELGEMLAAAITLATHALAHSRDGKLDDCRYLLLAALESLRRAAAIMGERE